MRVAYLDSRRKDWGIVITDTAEQAGVEVLGISWQPEGLVIPLQKPVASEPSVRDLGMVQRMLAVGEGYHSTHELGISDRDRPGVCTAVRRLCGRMYG